MAKYEVIIESETNKHFHIRPSDILDKDHGGFLSTFGKAEIETTADRLVQYFKIRGYWGGFTIDELSRFYADHGWNSGLMFFGLLGAWFDDGWIIFDWLTPADIFIATTPEGVMYVTDLFIERCVSAREYPRMPAE